MNVLGRPLIEHILSLSFTVWSMIVPVNVYKINFTLINLVFHETTHVRNKT